MARDFLRVVPNGRGQATLDIGFHGGQWEAWEASERIVAVIAGTQSGKTCFGPPWLYREIKRQGPGDYLVATPTFPLLELKALPEFKRLFGTLLSLGQYIASPIRRFEVSVRGAERLFGPGDHPQTRVFFGHAADPESLESATIKAAWLDEAGQKMFRLESFEAVRRRLALAQGRILITSTPYNLGWLKRKVIDAARVPGSEVCVVNFRSIANPAFPREEYERARRDLPAWKFSMFYDGVVSRPAGLIYDSFDSARHEIPRFRIPDDWSRYLGLDFGQVNTAGVFFAEEPGSGRLFAYRTYKAGGRTAREHVIRLKEGEPMLPLAVGGSHSEGEWRREFANAGLPVMELLIREVEVGIDRVYGAHKRNEILVFDDLDDYLDEKLTYSREVDAAGEPTEKIDDPHAYHLMDAERYVVGWLRPNAPRLADYPEVQIVGAYNEGEVARRRAFAEAPRPRRVLEPFDPEGYDPRRVPEGSIFEPRESGW
jgi:hypothetical protein